MFACLDVPRPSRALYVMLLCALAMIARGTAADADTAASAAASVRATELQFFETHIRPVLVEHCYSCHSESAKIVRGGLLVDSRQGLLRGGDSGPAIVPGDVDQSLLLSALRHDGFEMPPRGKLDDLVVKRFARWIERGAIDPRGDGLAIPRSRIDPDESRDHWAFQPVVLPTVPIATDGASANWVRNPIDAFVLSKLDERNWQPAAEADKYTLIRRATFDLTGLPPTPEEVNAFVNDHAPGSYERLIDRLLASPHYGQRWGRHWLDLVRYADTNGADENHTMPNAWRYRDWVFGAINRDQPLDEFIVHQLAGDLLLDGTDERTHGERLTATGMLVLGPKMLAEQDKEKMRIDIIDEQIDTVSKTFMGLTIACARCHDHKFDPIASEDYYALAGIFASTRSMLNEDFVSKWMERDLPSARIDQLRKAHQRTIDQAEATLKQLTDQANASVKDKLKTDALPKDPQTHYSDAQKSEIEQAKKRIDELKNAMPKYVSVMAVDTKDPVHLAVHLRGNHLRQADQLTRRNVPDRIRQATPFGGIAEDVSGRLELAKWLTRDDHVLTGRVMANRLWMWHFGKSLVDSPSNFGLQCPRPLHAELLDWLTRQLVDGGWSIKRVHRLIMTSSTYRMTSRVATYTDRDPENRYLWRQNRRRLEIEPLRDAILAAGGSLDRRFDGPPDAAQSKRRTVYLSINRAALLDLLSTFDYVEPANHIEQRPVTTVPSQALFLMNNPTVRDQAKHLAKRLCDQEPDRSKRMSQLWMTLFGRPPSNRQAELAASFVDSVAGQADEQTGWEKLCLTMIAGSQFCYVE